MARKDQTAAKQGRVVSVSHGRTMTDCILENTRSIDQGARGGPLQLQPTDGQTEPACQSVSQSVERSPHACS